MTLHWRDVSLEEIADNVTVGHVGPMADRYVERGIPFIRSLNVEPFRIKRKSALRPGDVIIVRTGKPGACAVIPDWLPEANCSDVVIIRCGKSIRPRYLSYIINSVSSHHISAHLVGAVQQHFNVGSARQLRFPLPPVCEQDMTISVLGVLDDKIDLNERMNWTLGTMAWAIFKDWFVDFGPVRAKIENRAPYLSDDLWALFPDQINSDGKPVGWEYRSIYKFASVVYGAPFASANFNSAHRGLPLIRIRDLADHSPSVFTDEMHPKAQVIKPGDIVVGMDGEFRLHIWKGPTSLLNQRVCNFRPKANIPMAFLAEALIEPLATFERGKVGTTVIHLGKSDIDTFNLIWPGDQVLRAFGALTTPLLERSVANSLESRTLVATRDLLLPKLMSGEIRVKDAEETVKAVA